MQLDCTSYLLEELNEVLSRREWKAKYKNKVWNVINVDKNLMATLEIRYENGKKSRCKKKFLNLHLL